jgi:hypothetical protein
LYVKRSHKFEQAWILELLGPVGFMRGLMVGTAVLQTKV